MDNLSIIKLCIISNVYISYLSYQLIKKINFFNISFRYNGIKNIKIEMEIIEDQEFNEIIKEEKFEETYRTNDNQSFQKGYE